MNQLNIDDLSFLENGLAHSSIQGGVSYPTSYSVSYDAKYSTANDSGYIAQYNLKGNGYTYVIAGGVSGAVAGAIAGAITVNGKTFAFVSVSTGASV